MRRGDIVRYSVPLSNNNRRIVDRNQFCRCVLFSVTRIVSDDWWRCTREKRNDQTQTLCLTSRIDDDDVVGNLNGQKGLVPRLYLRPCLQEIMGR
jgi:hypothetical protein